ncbi:MAG: hypothetical protein PHW66_02820 [Gallionella sp.]|jgi:hypothetical protein|nr:hypothetical protein [Gallionella sp.]
MQRSLVIRFLLVVALLFVQLGGAVHGIAHALAEQHQDQSLPHDKQCDLCAGYAQLGSSLGSDQPPQFAAAEIGETFATSAPTRYHTAPFAAFAARAPPHSV